MQHARITIRSLPAPTAQDLSAPLPDLEAPASCDQHAADHVDQPDQQSQETAPFFRDGE